MGCFFLYYNFLFYLFHLLVLKCNATTLLSAHGIMEQRVCTSVSFMTLHPIALSMNSFCSAGTDWVDPNLRPPFWRFSLALKVSTWLHSFSAQTQV